MEEELINFKTAKLAKEKNLNLKLLGFIYSDLRIV